MTCNVFVKNTIFDVLFHVRLRKCDYPHVIFSKGSSPRPMPCENFKWYIVIGVSYMEQKQEVFPRTHSHAVWMKKGVDSKLKAYSYGTFHAFPFVLWSKTTYLLGTETFNIILRDVFRSCHILIDKLVFIKWHFIFRYIFDSHCLIEWSRNSRL